MRSIEAAAATGDGTKLVMLAGTLCDERLFATMLPRLDAEARREITAHDPVGGPTIQAMAARLLALSPARFALLGFSLGGIVALEVARQAPGRLAGLALVASTARPVAPALHEQRRGAIAQAREMGIGAFAEQHLWPTYVAQRSRFDAALKSLVIDMAVAVGVEAFAEQVEAAIGRPDSRPALPDLRMPVLALCGQEDTICTMEMHREIASLAPGATIAVIEGAGHLTPLEAPDACAGHIAAWLDRVDRNSVEQERI